MSQWHTVLTATWSTVREYPTELLVLLYVTLLVAELIIVLARKTRVKTFTRFFFAVLTLAIGSLYAAQWRDGSTPVWASVGWLLHSLYWWVTGVVSYRREHPKVKAPVKTS